MEWSIIIFCYNEEENITKTIEGALRFIQSQKNSEIIIVNDGSTDATGNIVERYENNYPIINAVHLENNKGIGNALNTGYDLASKEYVCAIPGDGQFDIRELEKVSELNENEFVTFYRETKNYNLYRSSLTAFNQLYNRWFLKMDVPDVNWIKVYRKHQVDRKFRQLNSSLVESEISAKLIKIGYTHIDFPSEYLDREYGKAKGGSWNTLRKAISEIFLLYVTVAKFQS